MNESLNSVEYSTVISSFDENSGCWEIEVKEADRDKTGSTSHHRLYLFRNMPSGSRNVVLRFSEQQTSFFVQGENALVYLDVVVNFLKTLDKYIDHVRSV